MNLKTRSVENGDVAILDLAGRFDAYEVPQVQECLEEVVSTSSARIVVNMTDVNFVDSSGLAALVQGMKRCRQQEGDLYVCTLQQPVQVIFELTRLDKAFEIFTEEQEAISAFMNGRSN